MHKRSELFFNFLLVPLDFLMVIVSFVVAYLIRTRLIEAPIAFHPGAAGYFKLLAIVAPIWIAIFAVLGLYSFHAGRSRFQELGRVVVAVASAVMALIVWEYVTSEPVFPSRSIPVYALGLGILFVSIGRLFVWGIQRSLFSRGIGVRRLLLIGRHRNAEILAGEYSGRASGHQVIGILDDHSKSGSHVGEVEVLGRISDIERVVSRRHVDEIIVTDPALPEPLIFSLMAYADAKKITFRYAPTLFGVYNINTQVSQLSGVPLIELRKTSLEGWGRIQKRLFDLTGVLLGGLVISPLLVLLCLAVKLDSRGPVFYRHRRIGRGGRPFYVLKFRSMKTEFSTGGRFSGLSDEEIFKKHFKNGERLYAEFKKNQKLSRDPRVTRMGRFLRRTSLDELPQLWNVLKGEMTLVGPRPVTEQELAHYAQYQHMVLALKPGMTGLWQVSGRSDVSYEERVRLDSYYVENWSLWLDIQTILRTLKVLIQRKGAY